MIATEASQSWFWSPKIWLPPNVTWESFNEMEGVDDVQKFASFSDLLYPLPICVVMLLLRALVERLIFKPLGLKLGLKERKRRKPEQNPVLEKAYKMRREMGEKEVNALAFETQLSPLQVERWLRLRRRSGLPSKLQKFQETGWRWLFYLSALFYGIFCLWEKPWFRSIHHCWEGYPYHKVEPDVWFYYMVELSFYWTLSISQFFDVQRKDFWEMFIHHNTTIALIALSWTAHFTRVGTLVILVHDCSDHLLEFAKLLKYTGFQHCCDIFFGLFAVTWIVTRCGVFPAWILYSTVHDAGNFFELSPLYYLFLVLLGLLQLLNLIWTFMLIKAIRSAIVQQGAHDSRSDSESSSMDEQDENYNLDLKKKD